MKYLSVREQLRNERRKSEESVAASVQNKADIDYVAMMSGVELETNTEEKENDEIR